MAKVRSMSQPLASLTVCSSNGVLFLFLFLTSMSIGQTMNSRGAQGFTIIRPAHNSSRPRTAPSGLANTATAAAGSNQFLGFLRYPAELNDKLGPNPNPASLKSVPMANNTAYYRDFFLAGQTTSAGVADGDTIGASVLNSSGVSIFDFPGFTFHPSLTINGQTSQNCWASTTQTVCGSAAIDVIWITSLQCAPAGNYQMSFSYNGQAFFTGTFMMVPTIPPHTVPGDKNDRVPNDPITSYNQGAYTDQYGDFCTYSVTVQTPKGPQTHRVMAECDPQAHPDEQTATIKQFGCALTDATMVLGYFGLFTSPSTLNTYLTNNDGYNDAGGVNWDVVTTYAKANGLTLSPPTITSKTGTAASDAVCGKGPTIIPVTHTVSGSTRIHHHFVTTWGRDNAQTTYMLKDPNGGIGDQLDGTIPPYDYKNNYGGTREFQGPDTTVTFPGNLTITLHSPAELLITNSAGQSTGLDPISNTTFSQLPNAAYVDDSITDITDSTDNAAEGSSKVLVLQPPASDTYTLTVTGIDFGTYELELRAVDPSLQKAFAKLQNLPTSPGTVHKFAITTPITPGQPIPVFGAVNGGGQNGFLTFANPIRQASLVPAGQNNFPLLVLYGSTINPGSFKASLNGQDVHLLFSPAAGTSQVVNIPLPNGQSTLNFQISGTTASGQFATDTETLLFDVGGTAPTAPTNLTAIAVSPTQINLAWTASTSSGVTYTVFRSTTRGFTPSPVNQVASGLTTTSYSDTGLAVFTKYFYVVEAVDPFATSPASNQATARTQPIVTGGGTVSSITANFNGTAIATGNHIWFSSVLQPKGLINAPVMFFIRDSTITFTANGTNYSIPVPDANITFDPNTGSATTSFNGQWQTFAPSSGLSGNTLLDAVSFLVPASGLPGGIKNVTWTASFSTDTPAVSLQWQWASAVYTSFNTDYNALGVKPVDDNKASQYQNSDHAGTPENYKTSVTGGAMGGGGSNFTGSNSGTTSVNPALVTQSGGGNPS